MSSPTPKHISRILPKFNHNHDSRLKLSDEITKDFDIICTLDLLIFSSFSLSFRATDFDQWLALDISYDHALRFMMLQAFGVILNEASVLQSMARSLRR